MKELLGFLAGVFGIPLIFVAIAVWIRGLMWLWLRFLDFVEDK